MSNRAPPKHTAVEPQTTHNAFLEQRGLPLSALTSLFSKDPQNVFGISFERSCVSSHRELDRGKDPSLASSSSGASHPLSVFSKELAGSSFSGQIPLLSHESSLSEHSVLENPLILTPYM